MACLQKFDAMPHMHMYTHMHASSLPSTRRRRALQGLAAALCSGLMPALLHAAQFQELSWEELIPPDWDPMQSFEDMQSLAYLPDTAPQVQQLYTRMRKVWDEAPTIAILAGRKVKLPGFVVPLEGGKDGLKEFLLVPYFGACIHTPPPPANQIIHVRSAHPVKGFQTMSAVWVSGILGLERTDSEMGVSGYTLQAVHVEAYKE